MVCSHEINNGIWNKTNKSESNVRTQVCKVMFIFAIIDFLSSELWSPPVASTAFQTDYNLQTTLAKKYPSLNILDEEI